MKKHRYYEIYCEKGKEIECSNDNFSLCLKVPFGVKTPDCKTVEKFLPKKALICDGVKYHVLALIRDTEGGWSHLDFTPEDVYLYEGR